MHRLTKLRELHLTSNQLALLPDVPEAERRARPWGLGWRLNWPGQPATFSDLVGPRTFGHWGATGTLCWLDPDTGAFCILFTTQPLEADGRMLTRVANIVAAATYYYVMPHGRPDFTNIKGPVLGHFGTADAFIALEEAQALESELKSAGVDTTFHYYEGAGHAFFNDEDRLGTYDREIAESSWERSVDFLRSALVAPGP